GMLFRPSASRVSAITDPDSNQRLILSYYIVFLMSSAAIESLKRESSGIKAHWPRGGDHHLCEYPARGRAMLKPVTAEAANIIEAGTRSTRPYCRHGGGSPFV